MKSSYYDKNKHKYMQQNATGRFAYYVYSLISHESFSNYDKAIELGAGMGRFSAPIVMNFSSATLVEPVTAYADILAQTYSKYHVKVVNLKAEQFLANSPEQRPVILFCFHLMHHLKAEQRQVIYRFVKQTSSKAVLVEPNAYNPLILLQILFHKDMTLSEEIQYLTLTRRAYMNELKNNGLVMKSFRRFCFLPPFVTSFFLQILPQKVVRFFEIFCKIFPFMPCYQLIVCETKGE
jgi:hypothetical protein